MISHSDIKLTEILAESRKQTALLHQLVEQTKQPAGAPAMPQMKIVPVDAAARKRIRG